MTRILALDTSSDACSVALLTPKGLHQDFRLIPREHTRQILPMVDALLSQAGLRLADMDALAYGRGPGSFTGLRIAAGIVQGLAWGADLPVVEVSTLEALALQAAEQVGDSQVLSLLDARMDEVYAGCYEVNSGQVQAVWDERVCAPEAIPATVGPGPLVAVGPGLIYQERLPKALRQRLTQTLPDLLPHASAMARLALPMLQAGRAVRAEEVCPVYLRDEVAWKKLPGR